MSLVQLTKTLAAQLEQVARDLLKADKGNRAASQRVRTGTIKLEKIAKQYRKESVKASKGKKKASTKKKAPARKKAAAKRKAPKRAATKRKAPAKRRAPAKRKTARRKTTRKAKKK